MGSGCREVDALFEAGMIEDKEAKRIVKTLDYLKTHRWNWWRLVLAGWWGPPLVQRLGVQVLTGEIGENRAFRFARREAIVSSVVVALLWFVTFLCLDLMYPVRVGRTPDLNRILFLGVFSLVMGAVFLLSIYFLCLRPGLTRCVRLRRFLDERPG